MERGSAGPVRVALVGLGAIGLTAHLPALLRSDAVEVVAMVDPSAGRRTLASAAMPGVPTYADPDAVGGPDAINAVVLATPPWVTTALAERFLRAGHAVLAEKPVATTVEAARPLADLPPAALRRLQVGLTYRHDPVLATLRDRIRNGPLDGPLLIRAHIYDERLDPADPDHAARIRATLEHGSPVVHEGAHVFDWLAYLLDRPPTEIADAWALQTAPDVSAPNLCGARLVYPDRTTALVEFGWLTDQLPRCELSVLGPHGYAVLDGSTFRLTLATNAGTETVDHPTDRTTRCFDRQLTAFVDLATGRVAAAVPGFTEGLAALELSERVAARAAGPAGTPATEPDAPGPDATGPDATGPDGRS